MTPNAVPSDSGFTGESANDRLKKSWDNWFWGSIMAAVLVHFVVFQFWPNMSADDVSFAATDMEAIELPPEIEIPPPPEAIARPATPVIAEAEVAEDITIAPTTFEDNPVSDLPPPPDNSGSADLASAPTFTPYTVAPDLINRPEVSRALEREYPPLLRDAGIGGTARVWFFIDEDGRVQDRRLDASSGHAQLDEAAMAVASLMRFTAALNRDKKVPVWVAFPITFQVR
jgi:protein TonB